MAEGFELYHVPQQARRDKLRVTDPPPPPLNSFQPPPSNLLTCAGHGYDDLLTCASHGFPLLAPSSDPNTPNPSHLIKGETPNFMNFQGNNNHSTTQNPTHSSDPQTTNPSDHPQFIYPAQNNTEFDSSSKLELYSRPESDPMLSRQGLSLSLSSNSHHHHQLHLPMEINFQYSAPPGPFTGYTSILKDSIFLRPAQLLLQDVCEFGGLCSGEKMELDPSLLDPPTDSGYSGLDDSDDSSTMSGLISMLDEVYRRYRQYCQHLQAVVASFETIPGLNNAAPFANFALKSLSKHFKCLKTAITDQLQFMIKSPTTLTGRKHGQSDETDKYFALYSQRPLHNSATTVDNQPIWRPQRGLPERAVSVLRSWLFEHFLHPYPTDTDKMMLAKQTGLSRNQVSNWFINARVRLWKPMVEEIHALETHQQAHQIKAAASSSHTSAPTTTSQVPDHARANPSSSSKALQDANYNPREKRVRNNDLPTDGSQLNLQYGHQFGVGSYPPTNPSGGGSNGVSLTLALHQNNHQGMNGLLDHPLPYPTLALAHRYGLSGHDDGGCVVGGFSTRDIMGGQLSHDFIG